MKPYANGPQISEATEYVREGEAVNMRNVGKRVITGSIPVLRARGPNGAVAV